MGQEDEALRELAPAGVLRIAIALSPAPSPFFATADPASGEPRGVTVTLAEGLARATGLRLQLVRYPNSGEITGRADTGEWNATFMPADAARAKRVDFAPPYALVESTYLVAPDSPVSSIAEVDHESMRVVVIADTATGRSAAASLKRATLLQASTVEEAFDWLRAGKVGAIGLSRDALATLATRLPGSKMLAGNFHAAGVAAAVPKNRPKALAIVSTFTEHAIRSGEVRRALDAAGLKYATVAPPADGS
jgi:polar amino acid transport system substrate-binding protein